jgi:hypothetical protein
MHREHHNLILTYSIGYIYYLHGSVQVRTRSNGFSNSLATPDLELDHRSSSSLGSRVRCLIISVVINTVINREYPKQFLAGVINSY